MKCGSDLSKIFLAECLLLCLLDFCQFSFFREPTKLIDSIDLCLFHYQLPPFVE